MKTFLAAALIAATLQPAFAYDRAFGLVNCTGDDIERVYVRPAGESDWGRDLLGDDVLYTGDASWLEPDVSYGYCKYDFKIVYASGTVGRFRNVNLCDASEVRLTADHDGYYYDVAY